ncbi:MAG TPA: hypothetical protein VGD69_01385 [Herpetosiphonaceae bacterium]
MVRLVGLGTLTMRRLVPNHHHAISEPAGAHTVSAFVLVCAPGLHGRSNGDTDRYADGYIAEGEANCGAECQTKPNARTVLQLRIISLWFLHS